jgi:iron complex outermembrane receptor protein
MARNILLVGALVCLAVMLAPAAEAQDSRKRTYSIDVPRQALTRALEQLNRQTHVNYGYIPETAKEEQELVGPVQGKFTVDQALTELLRTTPLTYEWTTAKTITIVRRPPPPKPPPQRQAGRQVRKTQPDTRVNDSQAVSSGIIAEVISWASTIQRPFGIPAPVLVLGREYIDQTGVTTISELLRYLSQQSFLRPDAYLSNGAQYVELRGLGPDTTLVLINGRRAFMSAASFTSNAFDVNQLPLSAVERVEVKLDSVSVSHGADAIGGIVNIVLRDDIEDPRVQVHYGSADGGGEQRSASIVAGYKQDGLTAAIVLDYRDVGALYGAERDLWSDQDYRRFGSVDRRLPISSPGNVTAFGLGNLPGLNSPFAAIPDEIAGSTTQLSEFRAGERNLVSLFQYLPIVAEDTRVSAVGTARLNIAPDVIATAELVAVDRAIVFATTPPLVSAAIVPATNPYNEFGMPVIVSALLEGIDPTQAALDSVFVRGATSLRGKAREWEWEFSLLRSEEDAERQIKNVLDLTRLAQVLADPDPARTVNLLRPGPAASPEVLASLLQPTDIQTFALDATQLVAAAGGPLFEVPAGNVTAMLGGEWRKESAQFDSRLGSFHREVAAGFAELSLPLVGQTMQVPAIHELTLTAAGRFDRYSDFGDIFNPQYGLLWKPLAQLAFRATYSRSFLPPSMYSLYLPPQLTDSFALDPRRRETASVKVVTGGNRELNATRGKSYTAGFEFTPTALESLTLSATYWHVVMDERVTSLLLDYAVTHESAIPGRVVRAEPTPADVAAGLPGRLLGLDLSRMNFGSLTTSGVDFSATYGFHNRAGNFTFDTRATWLDKYDALDLPGSPVVDRVNLASSLGTITKWRAITSVDWQRNSLGATAHLRYIPAYDDTLSGVRNGRRISAQTFLDLQFSLDVGGLVEGAPLLKGFELAFGALNALEQEPDLAEVNGIQGYDISQGDLKGRFWYVRLGKSF